jgi:putative hydroxymethylpyrimidine transport system permease protein
MPDSTTTPLWDFVATALIIITIWQVIIWVTAVPHYILPGPVAVAKSLADNLLLIAGHAWITAIEVVLGLIFGVILGAASALYLMVSNFARRFFMPILVLSQTVPVFALAPILILWLGYGLGSKIAMTILIIYFPITSTFFDGLRATPAGFLDLAQSMQATRLRILFFVRVPAALPALSSGLRLAAVYAPIGAIIGEWVGASQGLGYLMLLANGRVKIDLMFAALITLCLFTILLRIVIGLICTRLDRWSGQSL